MTWFPESKDRLPLTWWKGRPIYLAGAIALGGIASMLLTAVLMATGEGAIGTLFFTFSSCVHGLRVWTPLTYVLVNPPSIWLVISSYMLWRFGEDVERYMGRRVFVQLLAALLLVQPLTLSVVALVTGEQNYPLAGIFGVELGVFLAFATLYPGARISLIFFTIEVWVIAAIIVGLDILQALAARQWPALFLLLGTLAVAYGYVRYEQGRWDFSALLGSLRRAPAPRNTRLKVVPTRAARSDSTSSKSSPNAAVSAEQVDAILDKINREGLQSLTKEERLVLETASERLGKRRG